MLTRESSRRAPVPPVALWLYGPAVLVLGAAAVASYVMDLPVATFMQDPAAMLGGHPLTGLVSNLGILAWCAAAVVCLFTYAVRRGSGADHELVLMIGWGGVFSSVWMFDDLFMLHEDLVSLRLGIPQPAIMAAYAVATLAFVVRFRGVFARTRVTLIGSALAFMALSVALDFVSTGSNWHHLFEDGAKFLGIVGWLGYFTSASWLAIEGAGGSRGAAGVDEGGGA